MTGPRHTLAAARLAIGVALATVVAGAAPETTSTQKLTPQLVAARRAQLQEVFDAYVAGDYDVVRQTFRVRLDPLTQTALNEILGDPRVFWQPARAAFTLEVAVALDRSAAGSGVFQGLALVRRSRSQVIGRPNPIGADAVEDRFEVLFHQIALAILQGVGAWAEHNEYVTAISPRIVRLAQVIPPLPNRFALARAVNAEMQCCSKLITPAAGQMVVVMSGSRSAAAATPVPRPEEAFALFEAAAAEPSLRAEAFVRGAYLNLLLDRLPQATAWLDRASPVTDAAMAYAGALIRAGVLDRQGQPVAAAEAYGVAMHLAPGTQVPAIGRAAALQRAGRTDEAVAAAEQARRMTAGGVDPWPTFIRGDAHFISEWLVELRTLLK